MIRPSATSQGTLRYFCAGTAFQISQISTLGRFHCHRMWRHDRYLGDTHRAHAPALKFRRSTGVRHTLASWRRLVVVLCFFSGRMCIHHHCFYWKKVFLEVAERSILCDAGGQWETIRALVPTVLRPTPHCMCFKPGFALIPWNFSAKPGSTLSVLILKTNICCGITSGVAIQQGKLGRRGPTGQP